MKDYVGWIYGKDFRSESCVDGAKTLLLGPRLLYFATFARAELSNIGGSVIGGCHHNS